MAQKSIFTVDVETDWGGRTNGTLGIEKGLPLILQEFDKRHIKGLFFISTELLRDYRFQGLREDIQGIRDDRGATFRRVIRGIKERGHTIGSHGHFHIQWRDKWRAEEDKQLSETFLHYEFSDLPDRISYRAPKFSYRTNDRFSDPRGHVGLLKHMWLNTKIPANPIFYLHPFDLVEHGKAPTMFTHFWYSRPHAAYRLFKKLCLQYS